jgi:hypothetical protein
MPLNEHFKERGRKLVWAAGANADMAYKPILEKFPHITAFGSEKWNLYLTVGSVYAAVVRLIHDQHLVKGDVDELIGIINGSLGDRYPGGVEALEECRKAIDSSFSGLKDAQDAEPEFAFSDRVGAWILFKLGGPKEFKDAAVLMRTLGLSVITAFSSWWE